LKQTHIGIAVAGKAGGTERRLAEARAAEARAEEAAALAEVSVAEERAVRARAAEANAVARAQQPVSSASAPAGNAAAALSPLNFLSEDAGWITESDGRGFRVNVSFSNELIDGQQKDVMTVNVSISDWGWAGVYLTNNDFMQRVRSGTGIRFKALGNGRKWRFSLRTEGNRPIINTMSFDTRNNRVVNIDIPFSRLRKAESSASGQFDINNTYALVITTDRDLPFGLHTIKIFDFEVY
jgi:hypothetical protein